MGPPTPPPWTTFPAQPECKLAILSGETMGPPETCGNSYRTRGRNFLCEFRVRLVIISFVRNLLQDPNRITIPSPPPRGFPRGLYSSISRWPQIRASANPRRFPGNFCRFNSVEEKKPKPSNRRRNDLGHVPLDPKNVFSLRFDGIFLGRWIRIFGEFL